MTNYSFTSTRTGTAYTTSTGRAVEAGLIMFDALTGEEWLSTTGKLKSCESAARTYDRANAAWAARKPGKSECAWAGEIVPAVVVA